MLKKLAQDRFYSERTNISNTDKNLHKEGLKHLKIDKTKNQNKKRL